MRTREDRADRFADALIEASGCSPVPEEDHQRVHILLIHRAAEGPSREIVDDPARAGKLVGFPLRFADEDFLAARGGVADARDFERSANLQRVHGLDAFLTA